MRFVTLKARFCVTAIALVATAAVGGCGVDDSDSTLPSGGQGSGQAEVFVPGSAGGDAGMRPTKGRVGTGQRGSEEASGERKAPVGRSEVERKNASRSEDEQKDAPGGDAADGVRDHPGKSGGSKQVQLPDRLEDIVGASDPGGGRVISSTQEIREVLDQLMGGSAKSPDNGASASIEQALDKLLDSPGSDE